MEEQVEEFKTDDKSYSRSLYLKFLGATVGNKKEGKPCEGDYNIGGKITRFKAGLLHGGKGMDGQSQPAIEYPNGHTEWWEEGRLHRSDGPAVITANGTWEEFWHQGELIMIRVYGSIEISGNSGK